MTSKQGALPFFSSLFLALILAFLLAACASNQAPSATPSPEASQSDVLATAAAQATAIIQQAQATAMVLQAQAQATGMVAKAAVVVTPQLVRQPDKEGESDERKHPQTTLEPGAVSKPTAEIAGVEIIRVGYAADGGFIIVSFTAAPDIADTFWPGQLSVTDEASGTLYNEVPVMPKIGPMISRPATSGQVGYIMFVNTAPGLKKGSLVTVNLGKYTFEHLEVQ